MEESSRILSWFSHGAASAVASYLALKEFGPERVFIVLCETNSEDADNVRFFNEVQEWLGVEIIRLKSDEYEDTWDVWKRRKYLSGVSGAPCTLELKVKPRLEFQRPDDVHVFGYTAGSSDAARAVALRENYPELTVDTPLIRHGLKKEHCLSLIQSAGIEPPRLYALGFPNNNCMPCVKATSPAYWALVRKHRPDEFDRMAKLSREMNVKLTRIKGERCFIDEIPADHPTTNPIAPACDFLCSIIENDMAAAE